MLWNYEDITAKVWSCRSVEQLDAFLQHVLRIFRDSLPHALISERWAQTALQLGLSCSSRHYAGRSLQLFRALRVPISPRMLSDVLSRLVETVAEQGEDMQVSTQTAIFRDICLENRTNLKVYQVYKNKILVCKVGCLLKNSLSLQNVHSCSHFINLFNICFRFCSQLVGQVTELDLLFVGWLLVVQAEVVR